MYSRSLGKAALESMSAAALILMLSFALIIASTPARAQEDTSQSPSSSYQDDQSVPNSDMSAPDPNDNGQSVRVPIPGGGDVTAEGPGSEQQESPASQNWSTDSAQPNSVGGGTIGPQ
jgi:hypothetical protein